MVCCSSWNACEEFCKVASDAQVPSTLWFTAFWKEMLHSFRLMTSKRLEGNMVTFPNVPAPFSTWHTFWRKGQVQIPSNSQICALKTVSFFRLFFFNYSFFRSWDWIQWAFILKINKTPKLYISRHHHPVSRRLAASQQPNINCNPFAESPLESEADHSQPCP